MKNTVTIAELRLQYELERALLPAGQLAHLFGEGDPLDLLRSHSENSADNATECGSPASTPFSDYCNCHTDSCNFPVPSI